MAEAIDLSLRGMRRGRGGPFGALIVRDGEVIARGNNRVLATADPTAHAEITAIRADSRKLGLFHLEGCVLYTTCEPCPMCLGAAYWARLDRIVYANTREDAAAIGFSDAFIYAELDRAIPRRRLPMIRVMGPEALAAFDEWRLKSDKTLY
jgi:tRNA(Arg) A34 adenosine deaminase TadA